MREHLHDELVLGFVCHINVFVSKKETMNTQLKGTSRQRSGKGAIRKKIPIPKSEVGQNQTNNQALLP